MPQNVQKLKKIVIKPYRKSYKVNKKSICSVYDFMPIVIKCYVIVFRHKIY